jgi:hypothetical protein
MADFRKMAMDAILADQKIDEAEVKLLRRHLYADGKIDDEEVQFLVELRSKAGRAGALPAAFEELFLKALRDSMLSPAGALRANAHETLKKHVVGDKKLAPAQKKKFMDRLKKDVKTPHAEFDKLYAKFGKSHSK